MCSHSSEPIAMMILTTTSDDWYHQTDDVWAGVMRLRLTASLLGFTSWGLCDRAIMIQYNTITKGKVSCTHVYPQLRGSHGTE